MVKIDLVTGFLGSGKTTFIRKYADFLIRQGNRIAIIENDYGAVNVDMMLLSNLRSDNCEIEMISGACDKDCHIRRFKTKLISMAMLGYNRVIVEPSGVFDVDEFFDVLREEPIDRWYEIGSVISIVDYEMDDNLSLAAKYLLATETAHAGVVLYSKISANSNTSILTKKINKILTEFGVNRDITASVFAKDWNQLSDDDFLRIADSGYNIAHYTKLFNSDNIGFDSLYIFDFIEDEKYIRSISERLYSDTCFGDIYRIKGFFCRNEEWYEFNSTKNISNISPISIGQKVIIIIGESLNKALILKEFNNL